MRPHDGTSSKSTGCSSYSSTHPNIKNAQIATIGTHTIHHYPIIVEVQCTASSNECNPYREVRIFITIHQPTQNFIICDARRPAGNRYCSLVRSAANKRKLSKRIGQKIFPTTHGDPYNGNTRTKMDLITAYAVVSPNPPTLISHMPTQHPAAPAPALSSR